MRVEIRLPDKEYLTVSQVAHALEVHITTAWAYLQRGIRGRQLRSFRCGGRRRVLRSDILAWLEAINDDRHDTDKEGRHDQRARQDSDADAVERTLTAEGF